MKKRPLFFLLLLLLTALSRPAYAYLDPGSGSMMLQLILGGIAGLAMVFKVYWNRLISLVLRRRKE